MSFTLCTSEAIVRKAGKHASTDAIASTAILADYCDQAESEICEAVDYDLIANSAAIASNLKPAIAKAVASKAAANVIGYDPTGYRESENQLILDILNNDAEKLIGSFKQRQKQWGKFGT